MYALTEEQYRVEAEPVLRQVFVNDDPFNHPFSSKVTARRIIYPCSSYVEQPLIDAVIAAASKIGDIGCYISLIWSTGDGTDHAYVPLSEFIEAYTGPPGPQRIEVKLNMDIISENIIYSDTGRWGIMLSHECNGLLGGTPEFIEEVQAAIPDLDWQVYGFLRRLQGFKSDRPLSVTLDWLPGLLTHVYGSEAAEKLLQEAGLP